MHVLQDCSTHPASQFLDVHPCVCLMQCSVFLTWRRCWTVSCRETGKLKSPSSTLTACFQAQVPPYNHSRLDHKQVAQTHGPQYRSDNATGTDRSSGPSNFASRPFLKAGNSYYNINFQVSLIAHEVFMIGAAGWHNSIKLCHQGQNCSAAAALAVATPSCGTAVWNQA